MRPPDPTDEELMAAVRRGDRDSYDELYTRWHLALFRYLLRRTCSRPHAEEALQETWLRVYKYRRSYAPERAFKPWVFRIATNAGHDATVAAPETMTLRPEAVPASFDDARRLETRDLLVRVLHALDPLDRRALLLLGSGLSSTDVAEILDTTASTVRTRAQRARKTLKERLDVH